MKRKWILAAIMVSIVAMLFSTLLIGCKTTTAAAETTTAAAETTKAAAEEEYVLVGAFLAHPVFRMQVREFLAVGKEMGVKATIVGPTDYNLSLMMEAFEQAIATKPAGIIVPGFDKSLIPVIDKAVDAGIPVGVIDADLPTSKRIFFVGSDWAEIGRKLANGLIKETGGKGKVGVICNFPQPNQQIALASFKEEIAKYPEMEVVSVQNDESSVELANKAAIFIMQANPDLAGLAGFDGSAGSGIGPAVKEAGKAGTVKVSIIDILADNLKFLKEGTAQYVLGQKHGVFATNALKMLYEINHSDVFFTSDDRSINIYPIPEVMYTGYLEVTPENIDMFLEAQQKEADIAVYK